MSADGSRLGRFGRSPAREGFASPRAGVSVVAAWRARVGLLALVAVLAAGCSIKKLAINKVGDALAGSGSVFSSDDDPELVKAAAPFSLKLMESLLAETPQHHGLLLATSSGFTQYAYAFVQQEADELEESNLTAAMELRARARRLYLRARNYGLRGLEAAHPGFEKALRTDARRAVRVTGKQDVPLLYWTAASWASAISIVKDSADLIADVPVVEALIDRALEADEGYDSGAIHSFLISYEMGRQAATGDPVERSRRHFERALELSQNQAAGPFLAFAEAVALKNQQKAEFESLLKRALAIDPDRKPEWRLVNLVMQRRARWLLGRLNQLFVE